MRESISVNNKSVTCQVKVLIKRKPNLISYPNITLTHATSRRQSRPLSQGQLRREPPPERNDSNYIDSRSDSMYSSRQIHREHSRRQTRRGSSFRLSISISIRCCENGCKHAAQAAGRGRCLAPYLLVSRLLFPQLRGDVSREPSVCPS